MLTHLSMTNGKIDGPNSHKYVYYIGSDAQTGQGLQTSFSMSLFTNGGKGASQINLKKEKQGVEECLP